jgi:hypothetical protein
MITASHARLMAQYNEWMNSRLYALCAALPNPVPCVTCAGKPAPAGECKRWGK